MRTAQKRVLMVCVGNLCRSPIAEAVMREVIKKAGLQKEWHVDSAGIESWHTGSRPDQRALSVLANHNIEYNHSARLLTSDDFVKFDYIFGMDPSNMDSLKRMAPHYATAKLLLLGDFGLKPDERIMEDPYYVCTHALELFICLLIKVLQHMGSAPFEKIFEQCSVACQQFLNQARQNQIIL